jgi:hypothetical protein
MSSAILIPARLCQAPVLTESAPILACVGPPFWTSTALYANLRYLGGSTDTIQTNSAPLLHIGPK